MHKTLAQQGFIMPAEWEKHSRTWLAWPNEKLDWPGKFAPIPWVFAEIARHITASEKLGLVVKNKTAEKLAQEFLDKSGVNLGMVEFLVHPTNRGWMRDCGAIFVSNKKKKEIVALDFEFNAWAKYHNFQYDNKLAKVIANKLGINSVKPVHKNRNVVLEGGAIEVNGSGTLITTKECFLSKKQCRNPGFTQADYEQVFADYLGVSNVIWLNKGIVGDDTHGHVDDITRFVNRDTVVTVVEKNRKDKNNAILDENLQILKSSRIENGTNLNVIELPMPQPVVFDGEILPASYANFLIANKTILVPIFNDPLDREALNILASSFPKHEVVGIYARDLVWGLGTIHCLTQQQPEI